jgi:hypothetical protein
MEALLMLSNALELLRELDPARSLSALDEYARQAQADEILSRPIRRAPIAAGRRRRRVVQAAVLVAAALVFGVGVAWAAGLLSPLTVFENNAQKVGNPPGSVWDQSVLPASVHQVTRVAIPKVGDVAFWYGKTKEGGWCGALQLPDGKWLGTGSGSLDAGGTVPGCYPTRTAINAAAKTPVLVINGLDYQEDDVDARPLGGAFWRIRFGVVDAPSAVKVVDRASGTEAPVQGGLFEFAVSDPDPTAGKPFHLVALDATGTVVADDCPSCQP